MQASGRSDKCKLDVSEYPGKLSRRLWKIGACVELADKHGPGEGGKAACLCGILALTAPALQPWVQKIFGRWLDALAELAEEAGRSRAQSRRAAEGTLARLEGALILAAAQGDTRLFQRALNDLPRILLPVK
jgi:hypothetical protein